MNPQSKLIGLTGVLLNEVIVDAKNQPTYGKALRKLKHDQDKSADYLEPGCPIEIGRAVARVTNAIYGEAISQLYQEAKNQPIREVTKHD